MSKSYKLISWNVNGIRAAMRNGFVEWFKTTDADVVALQEVKALHEQVESDVHFLDSHHLTWHAAEKNGYSGVVTIAKNPPISSTRGVGIERFDNEGRVIVSEFPEFTVLNIYFPNGQRDHGRLQYKMDFYETTLDYCNALRKNGKKLIICGDVNTAHKEIDLRNPKSNEKTSGFLPIERAWIDKFIDHGYVDVFRERHPDEPDHYTWWTYRLNARERNIGWRIDYFFVTDDLVEHVTDAYILKDVMGSDHCPIGLELQF